MSWTVELKAWVLEMVVAYGRVTKNGGDWSLMMLIKATDVPHSWSTPRSSQALSPIWNSQIPHEKKNISSNYLFCQILVSSRNLIQQAVIFQQLKRVRKVFKWSMELIRFSVFYYCRYTYEAPDQCLWTKGTMGKYFSVSVKGWTCYSYHQSFNLLE